MPAEADKSVFALEHEAGDPVPMLYGAVEYAERNLVDAHLVHVCRSHGGSVGLMVLHADDEFFVELSKDDVRWLASTLVAALDNWPQLG